MEYNGKEYPTREITVFSPELDEDENVLIVIGVQSLSDAMGDDKEVEGTLEQWIDSDIYFYVADDQIGADGKYMAENLLDEPFTFICEGEEF